MQYKVINSIKTGQYDSQYGEVDSTGKKVMYKYTVALEGESDPVEVSQKPSTAAPKQGDLLNGTIEVTPFGKKFKKEKAGGGFQGGSKSNYDPDGAAWGNAVTNATNLVIAYGKETGLKPEDFPAEILKVAKSLFDGRPKVEVKLDAQPQAKAPDVGLDDLPPVEAYDNEPPF